MEKNTPSVHKTVPTVLVDSLLVSVAIIWGFGFPVTQMALDAQMSAGLIVALRFTVAAVILGVLFFKEIRTIQRQELKYGIFAGVLIAVAFIMQTAGLQYTTPSNNAFLTSTGVVMTPFLGWAFFGQRPTKKLVFVAVGCFVGCAVLTLTPETSFSLNIGDLLTLGCALIYSTHVVYLGSIAGRISTAKLTFLQMITTAVVATGYVMVAEKGAIAAANFRSGILPVLFLGLFSTTYGFWVQTFAQARTSPTKISIILSTEGLLGSAFSVMLGYEPMTGRLVVGGAIIFLSLLVMELKPHKLRTGQQPASLPGESPKTTPAPKLRQPPKEVDLPDLGKPPQLEENWVEESDR